MKKKMKLNLSYKFFLITALIIAISVIFSIAANSLLLSKYYIMKRKKNLKGIASELFQKRDSKDILTQIRDIGRKENVDIVILDLKNNANSMGNMMMDHSMMWRHILSEIVSSEEMNDLKNGEVLTKVYFNSMFVSREIASIVRLSTNKVLIVSTSISSLNEAAKTANELYVYIGMLVLLISLIISYFFTKRITYPIKKLTKYAKKMAKLDFKEKCTLKTGDELEELGKAFNYLSNELEFTILKLNNIANSLRQEIKLKKKNEEKRKEFIANVSHELKTPIALVGAYTEGLKDGIAKDNEEYYDVILEENQKMDKLVKELLELSKLNIKTNKLNIEEIDIMKLIDKVTKKFHFDFEEINISQLITSNLGDKVKVKADKGKIEQVLNNVISNAVNHLREGNDFIIKVDSLDEKVQIKIFNSGSQIPSEEVEKLWDPFYKLDKSRNRKYGGTGLGLSIVKEILKKHGSDFDLRNVKKGKKEGVEFSFTLERGEN